MLVSTKVTHTTVDDTVYASSKNDANLCKAFFRCKLEGFFQELHVECFIMRIRKGFLMEQKDSCEECGVCKHT